jgi:hypothetical protein
MGSHKKQLIEEEEMGIFREEEGPSSSDSTNESECDEIYEHPQSRDTRDYVINTKA